MEFLAEAETWVAVGLLIFVAIILWKNVPALATHALDVRAKAISEELENARILREVAQKLLAEYQEKTRKTEEEAAAILAEAKAEAGRYAEETRAAIAAQIERRAKVAEEKIAQAEAQAAGEIRAYAADAAIAAAEKLITARLDDKRAAKLVQTSLKEIPSKLN